MTHVRTVSSSGFTLKDLTEFVETCKENKIPESVRVYISPKDSNESNKVLEMHADALHITFFDWI